MGTLPRKHGGIKGVRNLFCVGNFDGTTKYAQYTDFIGAGTLVKVTHPAVTNGPELTYVSDEGAYGGLDRFGRVVDQKWQNTAASTTFDRYTYSYDANSNRLYKENTVTGDKKDEIYTYDGLDRLKTFKRGNLNVGKTDIPWWDSNRVRGELLITTTRRLAVLAGCPHLSNTWKLCWDES